MRILALLNRRYSPGQSIVLLIVTVVAVIGGQLATIDMGVDPVAAGIASLTLGMGAYFVTAAIVTRRTRD